MKPHYSHHSHHFRHSNGYTLIEIMIALAIIAILTTLAYASYQGAVRKAKRAEGRAALMQLMQQQERFYTRNTTYIAFSSTSTGEEERRFKWFSGDAPKTSAYEIEASQCSADESLQHCVLLTAKPGTEKVNASYRDSECGELAIDSAGVKTASGSGTSCW